MIKISVVSYNNEAPAAARSAIFGHGGGTVGRSEDNHFVLPDAKHYVSRLQASIKSDGTRHTIANLSKANPILVNKREIDTECEYDLHPGDEIQIGLYLLRAELLSTPNNGSSMHANSEIAVPPADKKPRGVPGDAASDTSGQLNFHSNADTIAVPSTLLDVHSIMETDQNNAPAATMAAHQAEPQSAILQAVSGKAAEHSEPHPQAPAADPAHLMQAFLRGADIPAHTVATEMTPELMEMIGKLLAAAIQGTIKLNASRALVKREVKADVTMVVIRNNNPLKFFPDTQTVLVQMLRKKMPGFMGPIEAMEEALEDLHSHQHAVVAAMRTAANDTAASFAPEHIETKLKDHSMFDSLIPANRKAKLWDLYTRRFHEAYVKAEDDTQTPFGKAFLRAYEKEIDRIQNGAKDD